MSKAYLLAVLLMLPALGCLDDDEQSGYYCEQEMIIQEGNYYYCNLGDLQGTYKISWTYDHIDGYSHIDIYFLDYINFEVYDDGDSFVFNDELSREERQSATLDEITVTLNQDNYYFVVDHSTRGKAQPDTESDEVHMNVRIDLLPV